MISYIGGKSQIGTWIRDYIPNDIETYVETFGGMFWVFFRMDDTKYPNLKKVVYNEEFKKILHDGLPLILNSIVATVCSYC